MDVPLFCGISTEGGGGGGGGGTKLKIVPILNELKAHFSSGLCSLLAWLPSYSFKSSKYF